MNINPIEWQNLIVEGLKEKFGLVGITIVFKGDGSMYIEIKQNDEIIRHFPVKFTDDPAEIVKNA